MRRPPTAPPVDNQGLDAITEGLEAYMGARLAGMVDSLVPADEPEVRLDPASPLASLPLGAPACLRRLERLRLPSL